MSKTEEFKKYVEQGYTFKKDYITLGGAMLDGECIGGSHIRIPLKTLNRHGLIAGATGTGKTKTLQILAEQMSKKGIPSLLMDIKGDLSGIAAESAGHPKIDERHEAIGLPFEKRATTVELLTLSDEAGVRLRATISEFGPVLLSRILGLNDTQSGIISIIFKYCDDNHLPLLDIKDLKKSLQFISSEGKKEIEKEYGRISSASVGAIMRSIIRLEQQDGDRFFGETSFDVDDLCRRDENGHGIVSILRLTDIQDKPQLFSTFMMCLLAEIYASFKEEGDDDQPKLCIFIDEAHLIFEEASKELTDQLETIIKLIRSKGVGVFFCTQNPADVHEDVLAQLGLKIQHALRAFTARDRKAIKLTAQNFPLTDYYEVDELLTQLGIGEGLVTVLNEKGIPTPLVHCMLRAPESRMDVLDENEIRVIVDNSALVAKYNEDVDRDSAFEMLNRKIEEFEQEEKQAELRKAQEELRKKRESSSRRTKSRSSRSRSRKKDKSVLETVLASSTGRQVARTLATELARGILGVMGVSRRRR